MALHINGEDGDRYFTQEFRDATVVVGDEELSFRRLVIGGLRDINEADPILATDEARRQAGIYALLGKLADEDEVVITVTTRKRFDFDTAPHEELVSRYSTYIDDIGPVITFENLKCFYDDTAAPGQQGKPVGTWNRLARANMYAPLDRPEVNLGPFMHMEDDDFIGLYAHNLPALVALARDYTALMSPRDRERLATLGRVFETNPDEVD